jgi:phosphate-selective porin
MHRRPAVLTAALALGVALPAPAAGPDVAIVRGDFRFAPAGYVQGDFRSFHDWEAGDEDTGNLRGDTSELRRLRLGFELEYEWLAVELDVDPFDEGDELKDLYADLRLHDAFRIRGGHFKLPVSREYLTSASRTDFVERSLVADTVGPARDWGLLVHGRADRLRYDVGVFRGDHRTSAARADWTGAARLTFELAKALDLGASFSRGRVHEDPSADPVAKGMQGAGAAGFQFYDRHFVDGTRRRMGADLEYTPGPLGLKAEYLEGREERRGQGSTFDDLPDQVARGWAASATLLLTGDAKKARIEPKRPFPHGPGAIEVGVRYEDLRFDDDGDDTGFAGAGDRARNIRPAADRVFTGGLSWWPVHYVRFMGNLVVERYLDSLLAPEPGRRGNYVTLLFRAQLQVP